jgi:hypothetical protein
VFLPDGNFDHPYNDAGLDSDGEPIMRCLDCDARPWSHQRSEEITEDIRNGDAYTTYTLARESWLREDPLNVDYDAFCRSLARDREQWAGCFEHEECDGEPCSFAAVAS